jgi:OPT family oligopeptide transporter
VFFRYRSTAPFLSSLIVQLISYPIGKLFAYILPIRTYRIPLPKPFSPITFSLNPGPWNIKEHGLVYIMSNAVVNPPYALDATGTLRYFYGRNNGYWFSFLLCFPTQIIGFGLAGLCRKLFVDPASMIWPQTLVSCSLLNTLHAEVEEGEGKLTRWKMFTIVGISSFFFFFLPGIPLLLYSVLFRIKALAQDTCSKLLAYFLSSAGSCPTTSSSISSLDPPLVWE